MTIVKLQFTYNFEQINFSQSIRQQVVLLKTFHFGKAGSISVVPLWEGKAIRTLFSGGLAELL